jgi:hypothetical protein
MLQVYKKQVRSHSKVSGSNRLSQHVGVRVGTWVVQVESFYYIWNTVTDSFEVKDASNAYAQDYLVRKGYERGAARAAVVEAADLSTFKIAAVIGE